MYIHQDYKDEKREKLRTTHRQTPVHAKMDRNRYNVHRENIHLRDERRTSQSLYRNENYPKQKHKWPEIFGNKRFSLNRCTSVAWERTSLLRNVCLSWFPCLCIALWLRLCRCLVHASDSMSVLILDNVVRVFMSIAKIKQDNNTASVAQEVTFFVHRRRVAYPDLTSFG